MKIKSYLEYITELRNVTTDISKSGHTKVMDVVYDDPSKAKSPSSGVLLKNDLRSREFQDLIKNISNANIRRLLQKHVGNPKVERLAVTLNNTQFLKDTQQEIGDLHCMYCDKGPLRIYDISGNGPKFNPKDGATVDHKQPQSKGGDKFNYSNLAVCCYKCNQAKGNISYEDWMDRIKKPVLESIKIEREDIDNILIDLKDDFPLTRFFGYDNNGMSISWTKYLCHDNYQLSVKTDDQGSNTNPTHWNKLRPYIEEFIDRASDLGLEFSGCDIFQQVITDKDDPLVILWKTIRYPHFPDALEGRVNQNIAHATGLVGWVTVDFKIKKSFFQKVKNKFKFS